MSLSEEMLTQHGFIKIKCGTTSHQDSDDDVFLVGHLQKTLLDAFGVRRSASPAANLRNAVAARSVKAAD